MKAPVTKPHKTALSPTERDHADVDALARRATMVVKSGHLGKAAKVCGDLAARVASEPKLREQAAHALLSHGILLKVVGRKKEAIAAFNDVIAHFGEGCGADALSGIGYTVANALFGKAMLLYDDGKSYEGAVVLEEIDRRFGAGTFEKVRLDFYEIERTIRNTRPPVAKEPSGAITPPPDTDGRREEFLPYVFSPDDASVTISLKDIPESERRDFAADIARMVEERVKAAVQRPKWDERGNPSIQARARREARATTEHEWKPPSFALPNGLKWPVEQYDQSREYRKPDGILHHLERLWKPIIAAEAIDMPTLRAFYASTAKAIDNFKHNNGRPRYLPAELDVPVVQTGSGRRRKVGASPASPAP